MTERNLRNPEDQRELAASETSSTPTTTVTTQARPTGRRGRHLQSVALPAVWVATIVLFGIIEPSTFLTHANLSSILSSQATLVIVALALLLPLTVGDFDLSVASNVGLSAMVVAVLNVNDHVPIAVCIIIALAIGTLIGIVNGLVIIVFRVDAFIATLGMGTVLSGLTLALSGQNTISGVSNGLIDAVDGTWFGISHSFFAALLLTLVLWYVTEHTITGRRALFVGMGATVARLSGIDVSRLRWGSLMVSGFLGALAGVSYVGTLGAADPTSAAGFLLPAFAAAFLGATTIAPGRFNAWGTTISAYFLTTGFSGLELLGVPSWVQQVFYGGILIVAVTLTNLGSRAANRK